MDIEEHMRLYPHCPIPKSTFTSFSDEGNMHFRAGHYKKALYCFDRALELKPGHKKCLVARSQCHLKLGDAPSALADAEAIFKKGSKDEPGQIMGLYQYGEALFNLGEFEHALMAYHRGCRIRKDKGEFRVGVIKAREAISRAIADPQATQIEDLDVVLPKIEEMLAEMQAHDHCCILDSLNRPKRPKSLKSKLSEARSRWVDKEVLGPLQEDKIYLEKFLRRPDIKGDTQASSEGLRNSANEALKYLEIRKFFWRQQNPVYASKIGLNFNNDIVRQYERLEAEKKAAARKIKMDAAQGAVMKNITQIVHALEIGRANDCQLECQRALRQIKEISPNLLPRKAEFMTEILHYKGLALMKEKRFDEAADAFQAEFKVANENKMIDTKSRALDFLGRSYAEKGAFAEAAEVWDSRLAISKTPIERSYLYHEIGRCYYEMNRWEPTRVYGNQCLEEALKIPDYIWAMYAEILLGQTEVKVKKFELAAEHFAKAEVYGMQSNNKPTAQQLGEAQHCIKLYLDHIATHQQAHGAHSSISKKHSGASHGGSGSAGDPDADDDDDEARRDSPSQAALPLLV